jgi:hypothetical protein
MGVVFVKASRRARAYTRSARIILINGKINAKLARSTKGKGLTLKRENQLYALQSKLRKVYAEEVNRRHHSGRSKKKR